MVVLVLKPTTTRFAKPLRFNPVLVMFFIIFSKPLFKYCRKTVFLPKFQRRESLCGSFRISAVQQNAESRRAIVNPANAAFRLAKKKTQHLFSGQFPVRQSSSLKKEHIYNVMLHLRCKFAKN